MQTLVAVVLIFLGIVHLLPAIGVLGPAYLRRLYGLEVADPNLEILLRHRAVLFGLLGSVFVFAAFQPSLQTLALVLAFLSLASFLLLARVVKDSNAALKKVIGIDVVALLALIPAAALVILAW